MREGLHGFLTVCTGCNPRRASVSYVNVGNRQAPPLRIGLQGSADQGDYVDEAVGVAPLVVVPADNLDLIADHLGER
jgi:hypothetical protein